MRCPWAYSVSFLTSPMLLRQILMLKKTIHFVERSLPQPEFSIFDSGRSLVRSHGLPEITAHLFFTFQGLVEFLNNHQQLVGISCSQRSFAQLSPTLAHSFSHAAFLPRSRQIKEPNSTPANEQSPPEGRRPSPQGRDSPLRIGKQSQQTVAPCESSYLC